MMRLARFPAGRFASHHSSERERRELLFAAEDQKPGAGGVPQPGKTGGANPAIGENERNAADDRLEQPGSEPNPDAIAGVLETNSSRINNLIGAQISRVAPETFRSEPVYRALMAVEIAGDETARSADLKEARSIISRWHAEDDMTDDMPHDQRRAREDARAPDVEKLLKSPEVLARCIRKLEETIGRDDLARLRLQTVHDIDPAMIQAVELMLETERDDSVSAERMRTGLMQRSSGILRQYNAKVNERIALRRGAMLSDMNGRSRRDLPGAVEIRQDEAGRQFLQNLIQDVHNKRRISGYAQRQLRAENRLLDEEKAERQGVEMMKRQLHDLRGAMDAAIRQRATERVAETAERLAKILNVDVGTMRRIAAVADKIAKACEGDVKAKIALRAEHAAIRELFDLEKANERRGVSAFRLALRLLDAEDDMEMYGNGFDGYRDLADKKKGIANRKETDFAAYAQYAIESFRVHERGDARTIEAEEEREQAELEDWAANTEERLERLNLTEEFSDLYDDIHHYARTTPEQRKALRSGGPNRSVPAMRYTPEHRARISQLIDAFETPFLKAALAAEESAIRDGVEKLAPGLKTVAGIESVAENVRERIKNVAPRLLTAARHYATEALGIPSAILEQSKNAEFALNRIKAITPETLHNALYETVRVARNAERMESALDRLRDLPTPQNPDRNVVYSDELEDGQLAHYNERNNRITVSSKYLGRPIADYWPVIDHERGHAMIDILTREKEDKGKKLQPLFPFVFWSAYQTLKDVPVGRDTFAERLEKLADASIPSSKGPRHPYRHILERHGNDPETRRNELLEELIMRYGNWKRDMARGRKTGYHDDEVALFRILDQAPQRRKEPRGLADGPHGSPDRSPQAEYLRPMIDDDDDDGGGAPTVVDNAPRSAASEGAVYDAREKLDFIADSVRQAKNFHKSYKEIYQVFAEDILESAQDVEKQHDELQLIFMDPVERERYPDKQPENYRPFQKSVDKVYEFCDKVLLKWIRKVNTDALDTSQVPMREAKLGDIITLWSISDLVKFCKDTWEDIQSIYKRAQDRNIKGTGDVITSALRHLPEIPILGKYYKGLNAYHKRRYSGTEVEAANKWKEGMENEDSHTLLHYLHVTNNKDAIRGIISLLCSRGEMNWNDEGVWKTLCRQSRYGGGMPIEACKYDDVLRDTWLRKMITEIWDDRELYYHWRTENDSKIKSGKQGFTDTADQLSNVAGGGMAAELEKQLKLKILTPPGELPPEDVKPHLYEEVLEYAIRNGKMTMEQKFYYLIRGIAADIIGVERLRSLCGEKGEILMKFPFLDFFYHKNNSIEEIRGFAKEIQEKKPEYEFKPGLRTTLFLYYKVTRSESMRMRISKATARIAEGIDHEDIPFMITQMDWNTVRSLADVISGSRQKVTFEGWKNSYVGFNTYMKVFGELANLDKVGYDRFTKFDAKGIAQAITTYIFTDNLLTRNGIDKDDATSRPRLTRDQFNTTCPSGGSHATGEYRRQMNAFLKAMFSPKYLGLFLERGPKTIIGKNIRTNDKEKRRDVTLEEFAPVNADPDTLRRESNMDSNVQFSVWAATDSFSAYLQKLLSREEVFKVFKQFLLEYNGDGKTPLINEGDHQFTRKDIMGIKMKR
ncbi:phage tail tape measure protein [Candidatus Peregrinibacteria bacterium]|nr:phage tail tape measure protein [Candidatus Peregrinibacteria bacterium]